MSYLAILAVSFLAALSLATPVARQTTQCPSNGISNVSNFTLLSVSKADPSVQKPLALGPHVFSDPPETFLGTAESLPIMAETFVMIDSGIKAYNSEGRFVGVSQKVSTENGWLTFLRSVTGPEVDFAKVYCELLDTGDGFAFTLAVNGGDSDSFSLCKRSTNDEAVVVYNVKDEVSQNVLDYSTCFDVYVRIIPEAE